MFRNALFVFAALALSACGAVYISPDVAAKNDGSVQVVPLNAATIENANSSKYRPKQIPGVFFQNAGGAGSLRGAGALPDPVQEQQRRPIALETRIPPAVPQAPYEIGVGDVVLLATKSGRGTVEQLSGLLAAQNSRQGYTVQDDGAIAIPDVGRIQLAGMTLQDAENGVFQALVENQIDPSFSLEIAEFNSKRVSVGGAVAQPTIAPITLTSLTLDEALSAAGGINTKDMDFATVRIYRDGELYQIPLSEYLRRGDLQKTRLIAGDSVFVDTEFQLEKAQAYFAEQITLAQFRQTARVQALNELQAEVSLRRASLNEARVNFQSLVEFDGVDRDYVYLSGEVNKPGRFKLPFGRHATLADALYEEGGFNTETGDPSQIYVLRGAARGDGVTAYHLDARNVVNLVRATRLQMRPNDIIFVAEQPVTRWNRVVQQIVPSLITAGAAAISQ